MLIGYARVSTDEQNIAPQIDALESAGCQTIYEDRGVRGNARDRPGLEKAMAAVGDNDVLVVWKLDRLGRSLPHLIEVITGLNERGAGFKSLSESIDTTTSSGLFMLHILGALAEFERSMISERTKAGMEAARRRGGLIGRRPALGPDQIEYAKILKEQGHSVTSIARSFKVGRSTLYRALQDAA